MSDNDHTLTEPQLSSESGASDRRWSSRQARLTGYVVGIALVAGLTALGFWLTTSLRGNFTKPETNQSSAATTIPDVTTLPPATWARPIVSPEGLVDRSGVRIVQVSLTGEGGLVDLRFQVVDPNKAGAIHDQATPPAVVDKATGLIVDQLFMGHSHTEGFTAGQVYYLIFDNPGTIIQSGDKVSILLGNAEVDDVIVK